MKFIFGNMGAGKTKRLVEEAKLFENFKVYAPIVSKQRDLFETRGEICSRDGMATAAEFVSSEFDFESLNFEKECAVLVDEIHFFTVDQILQLHKLSKRMIVQVYGLLLDFNARFFSASKIAMLLASELVHVDSKCNFCEANSSFDCLVKIEGEDYINAKYARKCVECFGLELCF